MTASTRPASSCWSKIARELSPDVWVVAPEQEQSGASHSLTTRRPLRVREVGAAALCRRRHADRLRAARGQAAAARPAADLVLSGINAGGNIGEDVTYSGTVAAAMEATLLGIPAIALSQEYRDRGAIPWATGEAFAPEVIRRSRRAGPGRRDTLFNVNFPAVPPARSRGFAVTQQGKRAIGDNLTEGVDPRGRPYYWIGPCADEPARAEPGTDVARARRRQGVDHADPSRPDQRPGARPRCARCSNDGPIRPTDSSVRRARLQPAKPGSGRDALAGCWRGMIRHGPLGRSRFAA